MRRLRFSKTGKICAVLLLAGAVASSVGYLVSMGQKSAYPIECPIVHAADCTEFLLRYGIAVKQPPLAVEHITLPEEADAVYDAYIRMQEAQGFSLRDYLGREAVLYLYESALEDGYITLIAAEGRVCAADRYDYGEKPAAMPLF